VDLVQSHRGDDKLPQVVGYRVTHTFTVLVQDDDTEKLNAGAGRVLDTALENGANVVQHVTFFKQHDTAAKREALTRAVEEAVANAKALAAGARVDLRDTITINGQPEYHWGGNRDLQSNVMAIGGPGGTDTPLVAGDLQITCSVSVTCTY
jgi:uncharacterized protein YggE